MPEDQNILVPTAPEAWGTVETPKEEGFVTELPSGHVARVRRTLDLPVLLRAGKIPNPLAGIVHKMMETGATGFPPEANNPQVLSQLLELLDDTFVKCVMEPKFSRPESRNSTETEDEWSARVNAWTPPPGTASIFKVDINDKFYVFALAQGAAADLARFRAEQAAGVSALSESKSVPKPTKRTGGTVGTKRKGK